MSADELLALAERVLGMTAGDGAHVTVTQERSLFARFARSHPTQSTGVEDVQVEIACWRDGHVGTVTTNLHGDDALRAAARRAGEAAAAGVGAADHPGPAAAAAMRAHDGYDAATAQLDPAAAGAALKAAFAVAERHDLRAHGLWTAGEVTAAVATSAGLRATDRVTDAHMRVLCRDHVGRSGFAAATGASVAAIDAAALAERAATKIVPGDALVLEPGSYPVVFEAEAVGTLLDFLGWVGFNGLAHIEGRGALAGRIGTRVAAPCINLADTARHPRTLPRAFDAEGTPKQPVPLIQDGVAHAVVHDRRSAALAGGAAVSTGHALRAGGDPGGPHPTNLVLTGGGAADVAELCAPIERGLYVTRLWYVNVVHEKQALLTGMTRDGTFLIEDGRLGPRVRDVRFTDSVLRILEHTEALTATQQLVAEADFYGHRFAYGQVCPALRAQGFRLTGATTDAA